MEQPILEAVQYVNKLKIKTLLRTFVQTNPYKNGTFHICIVILKTCKLRYPEGLEI